MQCNSHYQLGLGDDNNRNEPEIISTLNNVIDIKGGRYYHIALYELLVNISLIIIIINYWLKITNYHIPKEICITIKQYHFQKYLTYSTGKPYPDYGQAGHGSNKIKQDK